MEASRFEPAVREVVEQAARAAQAAPNDPGAVLHFGMVLHAHGQYGGAVAAYRRVIALDPGHHDATYYLGAALAADGKYTEAVEPLRKSGATLRLADALLASGDSAGAAAAYRELDGVAQAHYGLGRTLTGAAAEAEYAKALALFPRYGAAQFALAAAYRRSGRKVEAEKLLATYERDKTVVPPLNDPAMEKVLDLNAASTGLLRKAQVLDREGRTAEALKLHEQVVAAAPKMDQAWVNMISLYARSGQPNRAEAAFQQAIALSPNRADAYYNFGVFCFGADRLPEAGKAFAKALELDPQNAEAAHNLGAVVEQSGDLGRAATLFQKAIALKPDHRLAHFHLGRIYVNHRDYARAIAEFERIIEPMDDQSPSYLYALAATHSRAGHRQEAVGLLNRARSEASARGQQQLVASIDRDLGVLSR